MTAPQHTAKPKTDEEVSSPIINCKLQNYKLQRCLFVGMGLLSSFGFIASQMGFAFAYSGNDFVVGDYAVDAGAGDSAGGNFIVADACDNKIVAAVSENDIVLRVAKKSVRTRPTD